LASDQDAAQGGDGQVFQALRTRMQKWAQLDLSCMLISEFQGSMFTYMQLGTKIESIEAPPTLLNLMTS
jgi:hypothetical protein